MFEMTTLIAQAEVAPIFGGLIVFGLFGLCGLINVVGFAFWIWALVDCCTRDFKDNDKIIWILVLVFTNWIGAIIYFLVGRPQAIDRDESH